MSELLDKQVIRNLFYLFLLAVIVPMLGLLFSDKVKRPIIVKRHNEIRDDGM